MLSIHLSVKKLPSWEGLWIVPVDHCLNLLDFNILYEFIIIPIEYTCIIWHYQKNLQNKSIDYLHGTGDKFHKGSVDIKPFEISWQGIKKLKTHDFKVDRIWRRTMKTIVFKTVCETFKDIDMNHAIHGSMSIHDHFQEKLNLNRVQLYFDPCKVIVDQILSIFKRYDDAIKA